MDMKLVRICAILSCAAVCMAGTRGTVVTQAQIDQFQKGTATMTDVESKLGMPQKTHPLDNGDTAVDYILLEEEANAASYIPGARLVAGGMNVHEVRVEFEFDKSSHLVGAVANQRDMVCIHKNCPTDTTPWQPATAPTSAPPQ
jgi:outer membrane protein assembly factor BamE (lipoprotein component of BamABCDE complex)